MDMKFETVREFAEFTRDKVLSGKWNQARGNYRPDEDNPCCVGAKIAYAFGECRTYQCEGQESIILYVFSDGAHIAREAMGLEHDQISSLLWVCGASPHPFSEEKWPESRELVWSRLALVEVAPEGIPHEDRIWYFSLTEAFEKLRAANADAWEKMYGPADWHTPWVTKVDPTSTTVGAKGLLSDFWGWVRDQIAAGQAARHFAGQAYMSASRRVPQEVDA